jgi:hypothetical protein
MLQTTHFSPILSCNFNTSIAAVSLHGAAAVDVAVEVQAFHALAASQFNYMQVISHCLFALHFSLYLSCCNCANGSHAKKFIPFHHRSSPSPTHRARDSTTAAFGRLLPAVQHDV